MLSGPHAVIGDVLGHPREDAMHLVHAFGE